MKPSCGGKGSSRFGYGLLRKLTIVFASAGLLLATPGVFQGVAGAAAPLPPFTECPAVGYNTSCTLLIDVTTTGNLILKDPNATLGNDPVPGTFDGVEDTLIGIVNNGTGPLSTITLSSNSQPLFGFDGDGICQDPNSTSGKFGLHCNGTTHSGNNYNNPERLDRLRRPERVLHPHRKRLQDRDRQLHHSRSRWAAPATSHSKNHFQSSTSARTPSRSRPSSATSVVGGPAQTFTATILDLGTPASGIPVTFTVSSGPNLNAPRP